MDTDVIKLVADLRAVTVTKKTNFRMIARDFHEFVRDNHVALAANISEVMEIFQPESYSQKMFRAQLIDKFKVSAEIMPLLLQNDSRSIAQALKCKWFFEKLEDPSEFLENIPYLSYRSRIKVLHKFGRHLDNTASAEAVHASVKGTYGVHSATQILPACGLNYIIDEMLENLNQPLPKRIASRILEIHPSVPAEICLRTVGNPKLTENYTDLRIKLMGRRATKKSIQQIKNNYPDYKDRVRLKYFLNRLTLDEFENWYVQYVLPLDVEDFPKFASHSMPHMEWIRKPGNRIKLFFSTFKAKYGADLASYPNLFLFKLNSKYHEGETYYSAEDKKQVVEKLPEHLIPNLPKFWLKYMSDENRTLWVEEKASKCLSQPVKLAKIYAKGPAEVFVPKLRMLVENQSERDDRLEIVKSIIKSLAYNESPPSEVETFFAYLVKRFRNETPDFLMNILNELHQLKKQLVDPEMKWTSLEEFFNIIWLNNEKDCYVFASQSGIFQYFHFWICNCSLRLRDATSPISTYAKMLTTGGKTYLEIWPELWDVCGFARPTLWGPSQGRRLYRYCTTQKRYNLFSNKVCLHVCILWFISEFGKLWDERVVDLLNLAEKHNAPADGSDDGSSDGSDDREKRIENLPPYAKLLIREADTLLQEIGEYNENCEEPKVEVPDWVTDYIKIKVPDSNPVACFSLLRRYSSVKDGLDRKFLIILRNNWNEWQKNQNIAASRKREQSMEFINEWFGDVNLNLIKNTEVPEFIRDFVKACFDEPDESPVLEWCLIRRYSYDYCICKQHWFSEYVKNIVCNEIPLEGNQLTRLRYAMAHYIDEDWMGDHLKRVASNPGLPNKESIILACDFIEKFCDESWARDFFKISIKVLDECSLEDHINIITNTFANLLESYEEISTFWGYEELKIAFTCTKSPADWMVKSFLHEEPELVVSRIGKILKTTQLWWRREKEKIDFGVFIRFLDVYNIPQQVSNICMDRLKNVFREDFSTDKDKGRLISEAICMLSLVLEPSEFMDFVSQYIPKTSKIEGTSAEVKILYQIQTSVCTSLIYTLAPLETLKFMRVFAVGDFLKHVANGPLIAVALSAPEKYVLPLLKTWLDCPVSLRKHVLKLIYTIAPVNYKITECDQLIKNEKDTSIRLIIFELLKKGYLLNPSDATFAPFIRFVHQLRPEDVGAVKSLAGVEGFMNSHIREYIELLWKLMNGILKECYPEGGKEVLDLVLGSEEIMMVMTEQFLKSLLEIIFSEELPSSYPCKIVAKYLKSSHNEEIGDARFKFATAPLLSVIKTTWSEYSLKGGPVFPARALLRSVVVNEDILKMPSTMLCRLKDSLSNVVSPETLVFELFLIDLHAGGTSIVELVKRYSEANKTLGLCLAVELASGIQRRILAQNSIRFNAGYEWDTVMSLINETGDRMCQLTGIYLIHDASPRDTHLYETVIKDKLLASRDPVVQYKAHQLFCKLTFSLPDTSSETSERYSEKSSEPFHYTDDEWW